MDDEPTPELDAQLDAVLANVQAHRQELVAALGDMLLPVLGWDIIEGHALEQLTPSQRWLVLNWWHQADYAGAPSLPEAP